MRPDWRSREYAPCSMRQDGYPAASSTCKQIAVPLGTRLTVLERENFSTQDGRTHVDG